jgi:ribose transport system ATP-binding protein
LKGEPGFQNVSFDVARGEVVGLFGLRGSGAELVAEGIAGLHRDIEGTVAVGNREYPAARLRSPRAARRLAIGYVPAERKRDGLVLTLSVQASLGLLTLSVNSLFGVIRRRLEQRDAQYWRTVFDIRLRSLRQNTGDLSGGNQQKVMVASRLATGPTLFVLQEPTRGVDVGARLEIHRFLRDFAAQGGAVLVVTTDVEEAVLVTDRLLIMRQGLITDELIGELKNQGRAMAIAAGEAR